MPGRFSSQYTVAPDSFTPPISAADSCKACGGPGSRWRNSFDRPFSCVDQTMAESVASNADTLEAISEVCRSIQRISRDGFPDGLSIQIQARPESCGR